MFDSPMQITLIIAAVALLFGAGKLPQLAKSLGQSRKAFKEGMREAEEDEHAEQQRLTSPQVSAVTDEELAAELQLRAETRTEH
jgi:TatA/E family protein of Tat protein translocase